MDEKSIWNCVKEKLGKMRECLKSGYSRIKREDLCQLCIYEEGNVNEFLKWDEENGTTPLGGTKDDLTNRVINTMKKKRVDSSHYVIDDAIVKWLSKQFDMDLEHVLWYFGY